MKKPSKSVMYKVAFALIYTFVMLPFSVAFFHNIASPPTGDNTFMGIIPLASAHNFVLPLFLAILEFSSINIAFLLWARTETIQRKLMLAVLFIACQSFPVVSVYYDINAREYHALSSSMTDVREVNKERITTLKTQIADINADVTALRTKDVVPTKQINRLLREKTALFTQVSALETARQSSAVKQTELDFVRGSVTSSKGALPMFLSFLFPITIISFARVIKPEPKVAMKAPVKVKKVKKKAVRKAPALQGSTIEGILSTQAV